jgi:hypothetical protein
MPDLAALMMRRSIGSLRPSRDTCQKCRRTRMAGESLHSLDPGRMMWVLCYAALPVGRRRAVRSERVHVGEHGLAVEPKAA